MTGKPKRLGLIGWIALFIGLLLLPWILLLGWMGLVPGVSHVLGARTPENLGVRYAETDLQQFAAKTGVVFSPAPPVTPAPALPAPTVAPPPPAAPTPGGKHLNLKLTQEELSAVINRMGADLLPLRNVQVKLSQGAAEVSGALDTARIGDFLKKVGVRDQNIDRIAAFAKAFGDNVPVYAKAAGGVQDAQLDLQLQAVRIGNFEVPQDQIDRMMGGGLHSTIKSNDRFAIDTLTLQEGALQFVGILPPNLGAKR